MFSERTKDFETHAMFQELACGPLLSSGASFLRSFLSINHIHTLLGIFWIWFFSGITYSFEYIIIRNFVFYSHSRLNNDSLKDDHIVEPRTWEYVTSYGKDDFTLLGKEVWCWEIILYYMICPKELKSAKSQRIGKDPTHWERPWCWERLRAGGVGVIENEMVGWHHRLGEHMSLSKLRETVKDREAWQAAFQGSQRAGHDLATK